MAKIEIERDGPVTTVIINRPEARNALDLEATEQLHNAFVDFERDDDAKVAVLWGGRRHVLRRGRFA